MSRKSKIRWRKSDTKELQRLIKNYNAKLTRVAKKHPEWAEYQPARMSMKKAREYIETRADYNKMVNRLKRYTAKGAEEVVTSKRGAKATKYEIKEYEIQKRTVNAQRKRERDRISSKPVKVGGVDQGVTRAEMGSIKENELKPIKKKFDNLSDEEWKNAVKAMDARFNKVTKGKLKEQMREHYVQGLKDNNILDAAPELEDIIMDMDIDDFVETVSTDEVATFYFYKEQETDYEERLKLIRQAWETAANQNKGRT